jgi:hypothetical protein
MTTIFRMFIAVCFAVFFVLPVTGQDSGYRFGFEKESQVVEQARKAAKQEAAKQGTKLEFQDPQTLRNSISELELRQENIETQQKQRDQIRELGEGGQNAPQTTQKQYGRFYQRPLDDGKSIISFALYVALPDIPGGLDDQNLGCLHEHFYTDSGECVVGYGPQGIYKEESNLAKQRRKLSWRMKERFEVDVMRTAEMCLRNSGQWLMNPHRKEDGSQSYRCQCENKSHYDVIHHNCQDFAEELRQEYKRIIGKMKEAMRLLELLKESPLNNEVRNQLKNIRPDDYFPKDFADAFKECQKALEKKANAIGNRFRGMNAFQFASLGHNEWNKFLEVCRAYKLTKN